MDATFAGMGAWLLPRAATQSGFRGGFGPQGNSLFPTHQVCGLTQAPSQ